MTDDDKEGSSFITIASLDVRPRTLVEQKRMDMIVAMGEFFAAVASQHKGELVNVKLTHTIITEINAAENEVRALGEQLGALACRDVLLQQQAVDDRFPEPTVYDPRK